MFVKGTPLCKQVNRLRDQLCIDKVKYIYIHVCKIDYPGTHVHKIDQVLFFKDVVCQVCVLCRVKTAYVTTDILHR